MIDSISLSWALPARSEASAIVDDPLARWNQSSDVCSWFWIFVTSESSVLKTKLERHSSGTIMAHRLKVTGCTYDVSCNQSLDLRKIAERSNVSLAFSLLLLLLLFLFTLETNIALSSRDSFFVARMLGLSTKSCRSLIRGLKCSIWCPSWFYPSSERNISCETTLFDLSRDFFTLSLMHLSYRLWRNIDNDWLRYDIVNSLNPFLYLPFVSALSLSTTRNP